MLGYVLARQTQAAMDVEPLVRLAQEGDVRAFEALLERRLTSLLRLAISLLRDEAEARDAVQQACVSAWRELPRLRESDRFDAWLNRIVANSCRDALRKHRRRRVREIAVSHLDQVGGAALASSPTPGPAEHAEGLEVLRNAFDRLDPNARAILVLHHLEGRSVAEIGAALGLTVTTVKWRLHRGRQALEQALEIERR
jgi:RNA polymerase sigma-70 factor (ECF subfamily)